MERRRRRDHPLAQLARTFVVLLVCAAALAALAFSHPGAPATPSTLVGGKSNSLLSATPLTFSTLAGAHVACPSDVSYTPDSNAFAFLGSTGDCASPAAADRGRCCRRNGAVQRGYGRQR